MAVDPTQLFRYLDNIDGGLKACQLRVQEGRQLASLLNSFDCRNLDDLRQQLQTMASPLGAAVLHLLQCPEVTFTRVAAKGIDINYVRQLEEQIETLRRQVREPTRRPFVPQVEERPAQELEDELQQLAQSNRQLKTQNEKLLGERNRLDDQNTQLGQRIQESETCCFNQDFVLRQYEQMLKKVEQESQKQALENANLNLWKTITVQALQAGGDQALAFLERIDETHEERWPPARAQLEQVQTDLMRFLRSSLRQVRQQLGLT